MEEGACPSTSYCAYSPIGGNESGLPGSCGPCPWGWRTNARGERPECEECQSPLDTYQWLYLGFYALLPIAFSAFVVEMGSRRRRRRRRDPPANRLLQHGAILGEALLGALGSLLVVNPVGSFSVHTCGSNGMEDWYTSFHNPSINFTTLHCTSEAVYPLYSLPFIYYSFCLLSIVAIRPILYLRLPTYSSGGSRSVYALLYFYPVVTLCHAVVGGLVYYSFPFLLLTATLISNVLHLAKYPQQQLWPMAKAAITQPRNVGILMSLWTLYAYAMGSITRFREAAVHVPLLLLCPVPTLFYILTVKLTHPPLKASS